MDEKTFDNHYEKHHVADTNNLPGLIKYSPIEESRIEIII
ncbi:hypothetical protein PHU20_04645 [Maribacter sp. D37]|nr:hypothetical protein [Maribacter polysaccharolyticus]MDE3741119.1 hypothetical protein [Maribacter polysaccharolyticus]